MVDYGLKTETNRVYAYAQMLAAIVPVPGERKEIRVLNEADSLATFAGYAAFWYSGWDTLKEKGKSPKPLVFNTAEQIQELTPMEHAFLNEEGNYFWPEKHHPNLAVLRAAAKNPHPDLPLLKTVVNYPYLSAKGMVTVAGYNPVTHIYLDVDFQIEAITAQQGVAALWDLFQDFDFVDYSDFVALVAYLLTPVVHNYVENAPMTMFSKLESRTRASFLTELAGRIIINAYPPPMCIAQILKNGRRR